MRVLIRNCIAVSVSVFVLSVALCAISLWAGQSGRLYVLGVTARAHGTHALGVTFSALVWCLAVPVGIVLASHVWSARRRRRGPRGLITSAHK